MKKKLSYPGAKPVNVVVTDPREHIQKNWVSGRFYETQGGGLLNWVKNNVPWNGTYIDVGANIGNHTLFMIGVMNASNIIAIEPVKDLVSHLHQNIHENGWGDRVKVMVNAAGAKKGKMRIALKDRGTNNAGMYQRSTTGEEVNVESIDTLVKRAKPEEIHYIKIDVEHMEREVISGAKKTLNKYRPLISIECEDVKTLPELDSLFAECNYSRVPRLRLNHTPTYIYLPNG